MGYPTPHSRCKLCCMSPAGEERTGYAEGSVDRVIGDSAPQTRLQGIDAHAKGDHLESDFKGHS